MIPVLWLTLHEDAPAKGYWDQAMLEALFSDTLYPVPGYSFLNTTDITSFYDGSDIRQGAVVIIGGRAHAEDWNRLNEILARFEWVLLVVTSDEEGKFPIEKIQHPKSHFWVQYPVAGRDYPPNTSFIPCGWPQGTWDALKHFRERENRHLDWFFAGQVTHERRRECVAHMETIPNGMALKTEGFAQGMPRGTYLSHMRDAKIVPCPSGPVSPDSFRLYEALEAGCVPIVDTWPHGGHAPPSGLTAPAIFHSWGVAPALVDDTLSRYPWIAIDCFEWWQQTKRRWAHDLADTLIELGATPNQSNGRDDEVTVLVSCSPIPSHPSTAILEETIASVRRQLPRAEIIIMMDGVRDEQDDRADDYALFIQRVLSKCNFDWTNVIPSFVGAHLHQALMTRLVMDMVRTPTILFVEHDTPLDGEIPWNDVVDVVASEMLNVVRFHFEQEIPVEHEYLMLDPGPIDVGLLPVRRTAQWSQRPHLASADFYRWMLDTFAGTRSRTMIEDAVYGPCSAGRDSRHIWSRWRVGIYHPDGGIRRSLHLDGRKEDPKFDMVFAYDTEELPFRAPAATRRD